MFGLFEPGAPNPKSAMLASRPRIHENCLEISNISDQVFKNTSFRCFFIVNYQKSFIEISRRPNNKLSSSFQSKSFVPIKVATKRMEGWLVISHPHVE